MDEFDGTKAKVGDEVEVHDWRGSPLPNRTIARVMPSGRVVTDDGATWTADGFPFPKRTRRGYIGRNLTARVRRRARAWEFLRQTAQSSLASTPDEDLFAAVRALGWKEDSNEP